MKLRAITFIFFLFLSFTSYSQHQVNISPDIKTVVTKPFEGHLHSDETGHYLYFSSLKGSKIGIKKSKLNTNHFIIEKYSLDFQKQFSKTFKPNRKAGSNEKIMFFNNQFLWFHSIQNKKTVKYLMTVIDIDGNEKSTIELLLVTFDKIKHLSHQYVISPDGKQLLFNLINNNESEKELYTMQSVAFDENLNKRWEKEIEFPISKKDFWSGTVLLNNSGDLYISTGFRTKGNKDFKKALYSFSEKSGLQKIDFPFDDLTLHSIYLKFNANEVAHYYGFYSKGTSLANLGLLNFKIDPKTKDVFDFSTYKFSAKELKLSGTPIEKKKGNINFNYDIKNVFFHENGGMNIIAEQTEFDSYFDKTKNTHQYNLFSNSIITMNTTDKGEITKVKILPKRQILESYKFASHFSFEKDNKIYFFYNGRDKNLSAGSKTFSQIKKVRHSVEATPIIGYFNDKNIIKRVPITKDTKINGALITQEMSKINEEEIFFSTITKAKGISYKLRIGTIKIE